ncbi:MAG: DUF1622 domain-containing protein [Anaerolineaceae bacterium]|jgi:uncharacterized membrane protein
MKPQNSNKSNFARVFERYYLPTLLIFGLVAVLFLARSIPADSDLGTHEQLLDTVVHYTVLGCELAAVFIIAYASIQALISYISRLFEKKLINQITNSETIRLRLWHHLSLALEFALASDILRVAVSRSASDIIILFAIILLRILLNYFLVQDTQTIREYRLVPELMEDSPVPAEGSSEDG